MAEVVLVASRADEQVFLYDLRSGTLLNTYKGIAGCAPGCLALLGAQQFIASPIDKPAVVGWCWQKDVALTKSPLIERVSALSATPDGNYIVAGTHTGRLLVWQTCNGRLHVAFDAHYRAITSISVSDDGFHCVTGGEDSVVNVWRLAAILSSLHDGETSIKPLYSLTEHTLPVTSVRCGLGGMRSRVYTSSLDRTCKVFELATGTVLASLSFPASLNCVATDTAELRLFAGATDGNVYHLPLHGQGAARAGMASGALGSTNDDAAHGILAGSGSPITCVAASSDGALLLAGDEAGKVSAWHVTSGQVTRALPELKGPVASVVLHVRPHDLFNPAVPKDIQPFALLRRLVGGDGGSSASDDAVVMRPKRRRLMNGFDSVEAASDPLGGVEAELDDVREATFARESGMGKASTASASSADSEELDRLRKEVARLKEDNARLAASTTAAVAGSGAGSDSFSAGPTATQERKSAGHKGKKR